MDDRSSQAKVKSCDVEDVSNDPEESISLFVSVEKADGLANGEFLLFIE